MLASSPNSLSDAPPGLERGGGGPVDRGKEGGCGQLEVIQVPGIDFEGIQTLERLDEWVPDFVVFPF